MQKRFINYQAKMNYNRCHGLVLGTEFKLRYCQIAVIIYHKTLIIDVFFRIHFISRNKYFLSISEGNKRISAGVN
jgi:hypothetical protein